jgi:glycosyltransferase involved in cell wall biosynthesis
MMQFSIVTPVRNGMPWLPEAMESVARQLLDVEVEHIVVDGGSTDGSREWLRDHSGKHVRLIFEPDDGQTDALIKGFASAGGDIFGWLNADDVLELGALRRVAAEFEAHPKVALVSGSALLIGPNGAIVGAIPTPPVSKLEGAAGLPRQSRPALDLLSCGSLQDRGGPGQKIRPGHGRRPLDEARGARHHCDTAGRGAIPV